MKDFVRLTKACGEPVCLRVSKILYFVQDLDDRDTYNSIVCLDGQHGERRYCIKESVDEILTLLEGKIKDPNFPYNTQALKDDVSRETPDEMPPSWGSPLTKEQRAEAPE